VKRMGPKTEPWGKSQDDKLTKCPCLTRIVPVKSAMSWCPKRVRLEHIYAPVCRKPSRSGQWVSLVTSQFPVFYKRNCQRKPSEEQRSRSSIEQGFDSFEYN